MKAYDNNPISLTMTPRRIIMVIISIQLILSTLVFTSKIVPELKIILIIRQITGFVFLTFVPGFLLYNILITETNKNNVSEIILYSAGLSISFLMFLGVFVNAIYLHFLANIFKPISEIPLLILVNIAINIFCLIYYLRCKFRLIVIYLNFRRILSFPVLFFILLLLLTLVGVNLLYFYNSNIVILIVFAVIAVVPILVALGKISEDLYLFVIWILSLLLLFQHSLIPIYIRGGDIDFAFYLSNLVTSNGFWDVSIPYNMNSILSIVLFPPIYIKICGIDFIWFTKIFYNLILSLLPVSLYLLYKNLLDAKSAFFSSYLFISTYPFFNWLSQCIKQGLAEFFLVLLIFTAFNKNIRYRKTLLIVIFMFSLITSHYGVSYIFMIVLILSLIFNRIYKFIFKIKNNISMTIVRRSFVMLYIISIIAWYIYVTNSCTYYTLINLAKHVVASIGDFLSPKHSFTMGILVKNWPMSIQILKILYIFLTSSITVGILYYVIYIPIRNRSKENKNINDNSNLELEYILISLAFFGIIVGTIVPHISKVITTDRIYAICLTVLSPFFVVGTKKLIAILKIVYSGICYKLNVCTVRINIDVSNIIICIFLLIFLLSNTGWLSEVIIKDSFPPNIYISKDRILNSNDDLMGKIYLCDFYIKNTNICSSIWLLSNMKRGLIVFTDRAHGDTSLPYISQIVTKTKPHIRFIDNNINMRNNFYIYLRYLNVKENILEISVYPVVSYIKIKKIYNVLNISDKIYTNGYSSIYFKR